VCKILADHAVKPHKVHYYPEKRDPEFKPKMAEILCVYRQVAVLREQGQSAASAGTGMDGSLAIISYDEKPGIQAIATTAPDLPPLPGRSPTVMRDHEYKRHGTLTLMAGIDLLSGQVHALVKERHRSREFIDFSSSWTPISGRYRNRDHPRQPFGTCLARDHRLACSAAYGALYLHFYPDPWLLAQSD
jgi:hypothetical protein